MATDDFWERFESLIPARERPASKEYLRKRGAGWPPKSARLVFEAVVYVLRTGCQWKALSKEQFGSASAVHKRFLEWDANTSTGVRQAVSTVAVARNRREWSARIPVGVSSEAKPIFCTDRTSKR